MANWYVRSAAAGAGTGADWANAYTTLKASAEAAGTAAGDTHYVAGDHAETTAAALSITFKGTLAAPDRIICVSHVGTVPPVAADLLTTATITTTGNSGITLTGCIYCYGIIWSCGTTAVSPAFQICATTNSDQTFEACAIRLGATLSPGVQIGSLSNSVAHRVVWNNTTFQTASANGSITFAHGVQFTWKNTASAITGGTLPTTLYQTLSQAGCTAIHDGVDFSALSAKTLVGAIIKGGTFYFNRCKLPASITSSAALTGGSQEVYLTSCSSSAVAYTQEKWTVWGTQTTETTIVRTGGTSVFGSSVAMKIVTTANSKWQTPFISTPLAVHNTTTAANRTITVYGIWGGGAVPNNDDIWIEAEYLGSASTPQASFAQSGKASVLATNAATTSDSSTWGGSTTKFKMTITLSAPQPQLIGPISVVVKCATASTTFYVDPTAYLS